MNTFLKQTGKFLFRIKTIPLLILELLLHLGRGRNKLDEFSKSFSSYFFFLSGMQHVYSTGGDGLVKQWSLKKGLCNENSDLMKVKRTSNAARFKGTRNRTLLFS